MTRHQFEDTMNLQEFHKLSTRTMPTDQRDEDLRENCAMGLIGEFGEVIDLIKKYNFHGHDIGDDLLDEYGDVLWYCAFAATIMGIDLSQSQFLDAEDMYAVSVHVATFARSLAYGGGREETLRELVAGIAMMIHLSEYTLSEVLERNVEKLSDRYRAGFSVEASIGRADR